MTTQPLLKHWNDWLGAADGLIRLLHEQTAALTLRDVARIERLQPQLDEAIAKMLEIDERAATCAQQLAVERGTEPSLRGLVRVLEKADAQLVQQTANKVIVTARQVEHLQTKNRKLIENELIYVNGTLTLIAKTAQKEERSYGKRGAMRAAVLVDQAA